MASRARRARLGAAVLALGACACGGGEGGGARSRPAESPPNVLLITIDTFRADHFGAAGYARATTPAIDALASGGARFTQAISQAPETAPSHATILTGKYPPEHAVRSNGVYSLPDDATTLAESLRGAGYRTAAFVGSFVLDRKFGFAQGFDVYDDRMDTSAAGDTAAWYGNLVAGAFERRADAVTGAAVRWLDSNHSAPFFAWVHFYDPHAPYDPPREHDVFPKRDPASTHARWDAFESAHLSGAAAPRDSGGRGSGESAGEPASDPAAAAQMATLAEDLVSLYDGEVRFCDAQVETILARLDGWGLRDNTLVILTSDHGESLAENAYYFRHGWYLYDNVLRVPLVVRYPGRVPAGAVIDEQVVLADLFPTICGAVPAIAGRGGAGGRDLIGLAAARGAGSTPARTRAASRTPDDAPDFAYSETFIRKQLVGGQPQFCLRTPRWKLVGSLRETARARRRLFDLVADPAESRNASDENAVVADSLEARLRAFVAEREAHQLAAGDANRLEPDDATLERLRALGYVK